MTSLPDSDALDFLRTAGRYARRMSPLNDLFAHTCVAVLDDGCHTKEICSIIEAVGISIDFLVHPEQVADSAMESLPMNEAGKVLPLVIPFEIPFALYRACCDLETPLFSLNDFARCYLTRKDDHARISQAFKDEASQRLFEHIAFCRMNPMIEPYYLKSSFPDYAHPLVSIKEGDTVICAGAFEGDTAVGFCEAVQGKCAIITFEPMPQNYAAARRTISNSLWADRIRLEDKGLYSNQDRLTFLYAGAASFSEASDMVGGSERLRISAVDVDSYLAERGISVDMIQLDVEGAEMDALQGAQKTIQRYKPKLQICIYHKPDHFWDVPLFIMDQHLSYDLYIGHHSTGWADTVLYAV